jgi:hypothetical protein
MGWATPYIQRLALGETVSFRPRGHSMKGKIESGQLCTVAPARLEDLRAGDIVLCKVNGTEYLHLVKAVGADGRVLIGNNRGRINGWTRTVFGRLVRVED